MTPYSTRQLAALLDLRPERVRALARTSLVNPHRNARGHLRFSFQDVVLLRAAKDLLGAGDARRVWRALRSLGRQLGERRPLCSIRMSLRGPQLLASAGNTTWIPESGQTLFDFTGAPAGDVEPLAVRAAARAVRSEPTAEEWFELGVALERTGADGDAEAAYRRAFAVDPAHVDSRINLGRLRHAADALDEAKELYGQALGIEPGHAIAHFNLGVVLEDSGDSGRAIEAYRRALEIDPQLGEAHYNLARLYELCGDQQSALRHLASYMRLRGR